MDTFTIDEYIKQSSKDFNTVDVSLEEAIKRSCIGTILIGDDKTNELVGFKIVGINGRDEIQCVEGIIENGLVKTNWVTYKRV